MMKKSLCLLLYFCSCVAYAQPQQSFSAINTTSDLPVVSMVGPEHSGLGVEPDAAVVNEHNQGSRYPVGTMFAAASLSHDYYLNWAPRTMDLGTWLFAYDADGNRVLSKKIVVPSALNFYGASTVPALSRYHINISSLHYDYGAQRELLVFTGSLRRNDHGIGGHYFEFETMVVGTYNLTTDDVEINFVQNFGFSEFNTTIVPDVWRSRGIGVAPINDGDDYMAVGRSAGNYQRTAPLDYPLVQTFTVANNGGITMHASKQFAFQFRADAVISYTVDGVLAIGPYQNATTIPFCGTNSRIGLGLFHFKAVVSSGYIGVASHAVSYIHEFSNLQSWNNWEGTSDLLLYNEDVYVGFSEKTMQGLEHPIIGRYAPGLTNPLFEKSIIDNDIKGAVSKLSIQPQGLGVAMLLEDPSSAHWFRPNETSIGMMSVDLNSLQPTGSVRSLYTNDNLTTNLRLQNSVTAIRSDCGRYDYFLSTGSGLDTDFSRVHVYGVKNQEYGNSPNLCVDKTSITADMNLSCHQLVTLPEGFDYSFDQLPVPAAPLTSIDLDANAVACNAALKTSISFSPELQVDAEDVVVVPVLAKVDVNRYRLEAASERVTNYRLLSMAGQVVPVKMTNNEFDLNGLPQGVYLLQYELTGHQPQVTKLLVE